MVAEPSSNTSKQAPSATPTTSHHQPNTQDLVMNAVAEQKPQRAGPPRRRGRGTRDGQDAGRRTVEWGLPHRGRISPEEVAYVREDLDEVQALRAERGVPLQDQADPKAKERYGLWIVARCTGWLQRH
jgi:hypothetical protein